MSRMPWALVVGLTACEWIDDEEDRSRRDNDEDGYPMLVDCDDSNDQVGELPEPEAMLTCGEGVSATLGTRDRLSTSTCLHPLRNGDELAQYASAEDLWALNVSARGDVEVRLTPRPGFTQDDGQEDALDLAGIVLWAWPAGDCPREHCHLGKPMANTETGRLPSGSDVVVRFRAEAGDDWVLVVSAAAGSAYELSVVCP